jgi:tetratricopeptide (TPR) repeat protein
MGARHQHRLWGLSADLCSLRDNETFADEDCAPVTEEELRREQGEAFALKDWDRLLNSLRRPPRFRPREDTDYARGRAWIEMGHPEVALLFFDNATRLKPDNLAFPSLALECLKSIPNWREALSRAEQYRQTPGAHPRLLFRAGDVYYLCAFHLGERENYQKAVEVVDRGLELLATGAAQEPIQSIIAGAYATKGLSLQHLDRRDQALNVFDEAVARFPENATLITARGLLRLELGRPDAQDDLKEAVNRRTPLVWAYLELARNSLRTGDYQGALQVSRQGLANAQSDAIAAELFEFIAIALCKLDDSPIAVRQAFAAAADLDPLNQEVRVNRQMFEDRLQIQGKGDVDWQVSSGTPMNALREIRSQMCAAAA